VFCNGNNLMYKQIYFKAVVFFAVAVICEFCGGASVLASVPSLTNEAPAPGKRVRITAPEYVGTGVYHTLYLPVDWTPGGSYPVIVEYAPNHYQSFSGTVEDTHLGYYQSAGAGCIWVSMPCINYTTNPDTEAVTWWGNGSVNDPTGESLTAEYTKTNLIRILEDFAGDNSAVFVTGFSRGAIACGYIALRDPAMADIWLGFMPHSHHDGGTFTPDPGNVRLSRVSGRASFITYGEADDSGKSNSITGANILTGLGFPVVLRGLDGVSHTDEWIVDTASASSLSVRAEMRTWLTDTIAYKPGTHSISGQVTSGGSPVDGARVQSGDTHWTFTDTNGNFTLDGLIDGDRIVMAAWCGYESGNQSVTLSGMDLTGIDLVFDLDLRDSCDSF
jgi:predicted esterase